MSNAQPPVDPARPQAGPGRGAPGGAQQPPAPRERTRAEDWHESATGQGLPPDYRPPGPAPQAPGQAPPPPVPTQQQGQGVPPIVPPQRDHYVDTSSATADGLDKCPRCGSTEITLRAESGMLICHYCRFEWAAPNVEATFGFDSPIGKLRGRVIGTGARNAHESTTDVVTLKCQACGAEVVVNTSEALQARCHWCRHTLSINQQLPNGAVPDGILPFSVPREEAVRRIDEFVKARRFFAHPKFVRDFSASEVVGVYMPYLVIDANAQVTLEGTGEIKTGQYTVKQGNTHVTYYNADVYRVARQFELEVDDVIVESSAQRADIDTSRNTNNIINTILPFDIKNSVTYSANYLRGYTSERRDIHVDEIAPEAFSRVLSIGRQRANEITRQYDRGVRWEREHLEVHGTRWVALYLPVWLYSYYQESGSGAGLVHYVAVNGRTGETMGSIPVRQGRLIGISTIIGVVGTVVGAFAWLFTR